MPSRFGVALVVLFWAATTGVVVYRDVIPRYFADTPPTVGIEMTDEATAQVPARWTLYRDTPAGPTKVGSLNTWLEYAAADDTFWFRSEYTGLTFDFGKPGAGGLRVEMPKVLSGVRVTRPGLLREQQFFAEVNASLVIPFPGRDPLQTPLAGMAVALDGVVDRGVLAGECRAWYPRPPAGPGRTEFPSTPPTMTSPLDPVPVTDGQVLNPMMPVARLRNVRPGRRWVIRESDPMKEAVATLAREAAKSGGGEMRLLGVGGTDGPRELIAEVRSEPVQLVSQKMRAGGKAEEPVACWVIDYRGEGDVRAATWVAVGNGRVLRQEASGLGEKLRFERED